MVTYVFSNFQVSKYWEKNCAKKSVFALFWNVSIWDGIKHVLKKILILEKKFYRTW